MAFRPVGLLNSVRVWLLSMPLTTRIVLSFLTLAYPISVSLTCLNPSLVLYSFQSEFFRYFLFVDVCVCVCVCMNVCIDASDIFVCKAVCESSSYSVFSNALV